MKKTNMEAIFSIAIDENEKILNMFTELEIKAINWGANVTVVSARDSMFSNWGLSKDKDNHVFAICFSNAQANAVESSLRNLSCMSNVTRSSLEYFIHNRQKHHRGTWSIKNANKCHAWNKGIKVEV